jgi:hypothetical protein
LQESLGLIQVVRPVDIEEWVYRSPANIFGRERHFFRPLLPYEIADLSHTAFQRAFENGSKRHGPQSEDRVHTPFRPSHKKPKVMLPDDRPKSTDQIGGKKGRVGRGGNDEATPRPIGKRPFHTGVNAGKGPSMVSKVIRDHRQTE